MMAGSTRTTREARRPRTSYDGCHAFQDAGVVGLQLMAGRRARTIIYATAGCRCATCCDQGLSAVSIAASRGRAEPVFTVVFRVRGGRRRVDGRWGYWTPAPAGSTSRSAPPDRAARRPQARRRTAASVRPRRRASSSSRRPPSSASRASAKRTAMSSLGIQRRSMGGVYYSPAIRIRPARPRAGRLPGTRLFRAVTGAGRRRRGSRSKTR